jgi:hypothetical protein
MTIWIKKNTNKSKRKVKNKLIAEK